MPITRHRFFHHPIFWLFFLLICLLQVPLTGANDQPGNIKILVLPFKVNAQSDLDYLQSQIATVLAERFEKEGAFTSIVKTEDIQAALGAAGNTEKMKKLAAQYDANRIMYGSFTLIDKNFSLDVRLMNSNEDSPPQRFFAQGQNIENLITVTNQLAEQISLKLFKRQQIVQVQVRGNQRIEPDAILRVVKTKQNTPFKPGVLSSDLRAIYAMGYFDDVRVESQDAPNGKIVIFHVKEKPTVRRIKIEGNNYIEEEDIRGNLTINTGAILNLFKIQSNIEQIETLYKEKNYHKVHVDYKINPLSNNQADLAFVINEGPKIYVTDIKFEGNKAVNEKTLKKQLEISEKGFFYWLTNSGDLDRAVLDQDIAKLKAFYNNQGYINAVVGEPEVDIKDQGIHIAFKIDEGDQYKVGHVDVIGDLVIPKEQILEKLEIKKETIFSRDTIRKDVLTLTDIYSDKGYAYADISPQIHQDPEKLIVDITFNAKKNEQVFFEKILIKGNTRTRDKVIRRELSVVEQGLFNGKELKRSIQNLYRLEYFEDIKVDTIKGSDDDKMILELDITEKSTGSFSFGAGYSSEESAFFTGSISQRNFLGRGQTLDFTGTLGGVTKTFQFNFVEPHLMDSDVYSRIRAYNQEKDDTNYTRNSYGGGVQLGYPVADYTRFTVGYNWDETDIIIDTTTDDNGTEVDRTDVPNSIKQMEGTNVTSSVDLSLTYDSRDRTFNTTKGSKHTLYTEIAGLGGDVGFTKYIGQTQWYYPIYKSLIGFVNAKIGYVRKNHSGKILPDYEKFYLGGINSLRGFGYKGVYLTEINDEGEEVKIGGDKMVQFNFEFITPFVPEAGVNFVVFFDNGNIYDSEASINLSDLRTSAGAGIRWLSPIAPIRLEYGWILDRQGDEPSGDWEFTLGGSF